MSAYLESFELKNKREAAIYTAAITAAILCLFYFITIFKDADTIKPDYGIEVNFGTSDKGSGDLQTFNEASDLKNPEESAPKETNDVKNTAPPIEKPAEPKVEKVKAATKVETAVTSKVESPVKIKEAPAKAKPTPVKTEEATKPAKPTPTPAKVEPAKPTPIPPKPDAGSLYSKAGTKAGGNGTKGTSTTPGGNNNGDGAKGEVGDKGDPKGKIDAPLYSGKPGSGGTGGGGAGGGSGSSLEMSGWKIGRKLEVNDNSDDTGMVRFEVKVDDQGQLLSIKVLQNTLSQSLVNKIKKALESASFVPTGAGNLPPVSTGRFTYRINPRN
jgi:hypothetical protein